MKTIIAILFVCSVAVTQDIAPTQSSRQFFVDGALTIGFTTPITSWCLDRGSWSYCTADASTNKCQSGWHRMKKPYPYEDFVCAKRIKAKVGAHSEATGKPDSEKPKKSPFGNEQVLILRH